MELWKVPKKVQKKDKKAIAGLKIGTMFAPAKTGNPVCAEVHPRWYLLVSDFGKKIFFKKISKSIVGIKKGFYICTRFGRKVPE